MPSIVVSPSRRYLARFHPKRIPHVFTDVLIIGSGIAGLRAALEIPSDLRTIIISKDRLAQSNSTYAQGGIAGVLDPVDDFSNHVADTLSAGKGLCDESVVEMVVHEAPDRIQELIEWGAQFDFENGELALGQEGGHSHRRIAHALGDATGKEVMRALISTSLGLPNADFWEQTFVIDLLTHEGTCQGALLWNKSHGKTLVWAKQTILATGGAGQIYRETTNPNVATADGHAVAFRAGARMRDMEFMQFHPTVLYIAGSSRHLISEAVRGEGAYLRDSNGYRFMGDYVPDQMELAPRDIVSQSIVHQMEKTRHPSVYLDLKHLDRQRVLDRFPHISHVCAEFGLDITCDLIPVRPGAHYMVGGATIDTDGRTTVPGLWAAGEVSSSGLHGANRLASNSLLEGLVFGRRAGRGAAEAAAGRADQYTVLPLVGDWPHSRQDDEELDLLDLRNSLGSEMWRNVGIERDQAGLSSAERQVEFWNRYVSLREFPGPPGWELQNMLLVSKLMIAAALKRTESRGTHFRRDYPQTDAAQASHLTIVDQGAS